MASHRLSPSIDHRARGRFLAVLAVTVLVSGCMPGLLIPVSPDESPSASAGPNAVADPLDGSDRYSVAVSIATRLSSRGAVPVVYLVPGEAYADGVAAGPAAAKDGGAVLYTTRGKLPPAVSDELARLNPARVEIVGPASLIAESVAATLQKQLGSATLVERASGTTPYAVAASISSRAFAAGSVKTVVVASAGDYWAAVSAGLAAAHLGSPLLLVARDGLPGVTATELRRLAPESVVVVGDSASVSAKVVADIGAIVPNPERISSAGRYAIAAAIAARYFPNATTVIATSGVSDAGAIAAVPLAVAENAPILLTQGDDQLPKATRDSLVAMRPATIVTAGPVSAINKAELLGFSDGRIAVPTETATYKAPATGYHDPAEMYTLIKATEIAYPTLVHVFSIGKSYEGRDIWAAKVSANVSLDEDEPEVLVDALHHANERLGVEQALYLLGTLTSGYATDPTVHRLMDSRVVWIVFALNPDGWAYDLSGTGFAGWRKNRQPNGKYRAGTDLNRNYGYQWGCCRDGSDLPYAWNYRGTAPFSAPETRALADFIASRVVDGKQRIRTHVTFHTNGELILYPFAYTIARLPPAMKPDDYAVFEAMALNMARMNGYLAEQSSFLYPSPGDMIDWTYSTYEIFSFTFELYPTKAAGRGVAYVPDTVIARQTARNRGALLYLIDAAACPYTAIGKAAKYCAGRTAPSPSV